MAMIFQKRSTRTRVSTETGMALLGGHALMLGPSDIQLGVNESLKDTALVLKRFNSLILARVFAHSDVVELAEYAPLVINGLSDLHHPLQTLADLMTLQEHFGNDRAELKGKAIAWVGDGNNVLHDLMLGAASLGMPVQIATPPGFEPDAGVLAAARARADAAGVSITLSNDPKIACDGAHAIFTDTWVSMGEEDQAAEKLALFAGYQVNADLMARGAPGAVFMHCLPRHKEEVTDDVFYSPSSLVFPEAENRMWTVMAVAESMLGVE